MALILEIRKAIVISTQGADKIILEVRNSGRNIQEPCYPFEGSLNVSFTAAKGSGKDYCVTILRLDEDQIKEVGV